VKPLFDITKIVSDPQILFSGFLLAIFLKVTHRHLVPKLIFRIVNSQVTFLMVIVLLLIPVYLRNSTFFTISPDSQGLLRSPSGNTTYRPALLWGVYRLFASQREIDRFFSSKPVSGEKLNYPEILQGSNFVMALYLISLVTVLWVFYKNLNIDARLLVMVVLLQTSGPLYYASDYFYIPTQLVPAYKLLFYFFHSKSYK
jgi:hypothetical protein